MSKNDEERSSREKSNQNIDKDQWEKLRVNFYRDIPKFPGNKIYANIKIQPESARKLIKHFGLIINDSSRCTIDRDFHEISASGFNLKDKDHIKVQIKAFPYNEDWEPISSNTCTFTFIGKNSGFFDAVTSFDWINESNVTVILQWNHIGDRMAEKYVICLDNKEVYYINQLQIEEELKFCIHNLKPGEKHTLEIIAKLKRKETCRSNLIEFTIPTTKEEMTTEVITVTDEPIPISLLEIAKNIKEEDEDNKQHDRASELLRLLTEQIKERTKGY